MSGCPHGFPSVKSCVDCMYEVGVGAESQEPVTVEATFKAQFDGDCSGCHLAVHAGQVISKLSDGRYVHERCA